MVEDRTENNGYKGNMNKSRIDELDGIGTYLEWLEPERRDIEHRYVRYNQAINIIQEVEKERDYYHDLAMKCRKEKRYPSQNEISTLTGECPVHRGTEQ